MESMSLSSRHFRRFSTYFVSRSEYFKGVLVSLRQIVRSNLPSMFEGFHQLYGVFSVKILLIGISLDSPYIS